MTTKPEKDGELRPCPFCGSLPEEKSNDCRCGVFGTLKYADDCDFIDHWNNAYCWKLLDEADSLLTLTYRFLTGHASKSKSNKEYLIEKIGEYFNLKEEKK